MPAAQFHSLQIVERQPEGRDGFSLTFAVPEGLREQYQFQHGQYLTLRAEIAGESIRRSYSICCGVNHFKNHQQLKVGIKRVPGGQFSEYAFKSFRPGRAVDVMTPQGRFTTALSPDQMRRYLAVAAGSGITPILSMIDTILEHEPLAHITLLYGNRSIEQMMFLEALENLKNRFLQRFQLIHVLSAQAQEVELFNGRIDGSKIKALGEGLLNLKRFDVAMVCGPETMIDDVTQALMNAGLRPEQILSERFGTPGLQPTRVAAHTDAGVEGADLTVLLDGKPRRMKLPYQGTNLLDVALAQGLDLPYACKGGVCCTCRAKVLKGQVAMEKNYTLEQWEIDKGFVLTCQCRPLTPEVVVSFDER